MHKKIDKTVKRCYSNIRKQHKGVPYRFLFGMGMPDKLIVWRFLIVTESCLLWGKGGSHFLCHSKNKPPALQVEGISSDKSNSCAKIDVGLQTTNKKAQEVQKWTITV